MIIGKAAHVIFDFIRRVGETKFDINPIQNELKVNIHNIGFMESIKSEYYKYHHDGLYYEEYRIDINRYTPGSEQKDKDIAWSYSFNIITITNLKDKFDIIWDGIYSEIDFANDTYSIKEYSIYKYRDQDTYRVERINTRCPELIKTVEYGKPNIIYPADHKE